MDEALEDIRNELGIDLRDEIQGVTVFGGKLPVNEGALVLHGSLNQDTQDAILAKLDLEGAEVSTAFAGGLAWYTVAENSGNITYTEEDGTVQDVDWGRSEKGYFSFGATQTLITHSDTLMQTFLDAGGYLGGFENSDPGALVVMQADRALIQGGANTTVDLGGPWDSSIMQNVDAIAVVVSELSGGLHISAELVASSPEVAMSVRNVAEGLVALKALDDSEEVIGDVLRSVRFQNDGEILRVEVPVAADQVEALRDL